MVLSIAVIQLVGEDWGIFTFGYSTFGQHMFMVAYFGIRPFHITDTRQRYTFGEYLRLRFITCGAALPSAFCMWLPMGEPIPGRKPSSYFSW